MEILPRFPGGGYLSQPCIFEVALTQMRLRIVTQTGKAACWQPIKATTTTAMILISFGGSHFEYLGRANIEPT
jgi:hypothetical protein